MKKQILLFQFRHNPTAEHELRCLKNAMKLNSRDFEIINVIEKAEDIPSVSELHKYSGIIFGASSDYNITDWSDEVRIKCERTKPILEYALKNNIPTLGICFGHQLIAHLLGGTVLRDDSQAEGGVVNMYLNIEGEQSSLFKNIPKTFPIASGHKDSVTFIPVSDLHVLASSDKTKIEAYRIGESVFGIQPHPELDRDGLVWRMSLFPEYTRGRSIREIKKEFVDMPYGDLILKNFKRLVERSIIASRGPLAQLARAIH